MLHHYIQVKVLFLEREVNFLEQALQISIPGSIAAIDTARQLDLARDQLIFGQNLLKEQRI